MASKQTFAEILGRKQTESLNNRDSALPVKGGRQSIPEDAGTIGGLFNQLALIDPDFPIHLLNCIENLAKYHPEVSLAVENIVTLANTKYTVTFDDAVSKRESKRANQRIKEKGKKWYAYSGGLNSLINDLLAQAAMTGAVSAESVPDNNLEGVKKVVKVSPRNIRFRYDKEKDEYLPNQVSAGTSIVTTGTNALSYVELNTNTYCYIASRRFNEKPYAIPPFLAAVWNISIDKDMMGNISTIISKLGVMGFLQVLVKAPAMKPNEGQDAYWNRTKSYLSKVAPEIEKGLNKGYVVGYENVHQFNMQNTTTNVQGTKDLVEINDTKFMAGLKQDPLMFGRNFSTTETLGRVILAKMGTQVRNYQQLVASYLESLFLLDLQLAGFNVKTVTVTFDPPMIGDKVKEEEAKGKKFDNLQKEYNQGLISQQQFAEEMGREKPDQDEPRASVNMPAPNVGDDTTDDEGGPNTDPDEGEDDATDEGTTAANKKLLLKYTGVKLLTLEYNTGRTETVVCAGGRIPNSYYKLGKIISVGDDITLAKATDLLLEKYYPYAGTFPYENCTCCSTSLNKPNIPETSNLIKGLVDDLSKFVKQYFLESRKNYRKAVDKMTAKVGTALGNLGNGASEQQITDLILLTIYSDWDSTFTAPQKKIVNKFTNLIYRFFRNDKSVFNVSDTGEIPNAAFTSIDVRALDYYKKFDTVYLGKFITDADLKKDITDFIKEEFLSRNIPIGDNRAILASFKNKFGTVLQGKEWKISQIINTSVNKMRNSAAVSYFQQAEVETFEIRGVNDSKQCEYCSNLQGKQFSVSTTVTALENAYDSDPEFVGVDTPFITSIFKKPEDMEDLTGEQLQAQGFNILPAHPHCRDVAVPIL